MKTKIYKWLACPCMAAVLATMTACYDDLGDKAGTEKGFQNVEVPQINVTGSNVIDFSSIEMSATYSNTADIMETGIIVSKSNDMSDCETFKTSTVQSDMSVTATGLSEQTRYYICAYAYMKDGSTATSQIKELDTPKAPEFTAAMLNGKTYTAKNVSDSWTTPNTFDMTLTVTVDEEDENKVWITGLFPYAEYYLYNYYSSKVYGIVDTEAMTITIPKYQSLGTEFDKYNFYMFGFDADWNYIDIVLNIVDKGGSLNTTCGLATSDGTWWYDYFCNTITFK